MATKRLDPPARCWLCGCTDAEPYAEIDRWQYVRCRECELVYLFPRPTPSELSDLYSKAYFDDLKGDGQINYMEIADSRIEANAERVAYLNGLRAPGKLVELGCAAGYFLEAARRQGWDCTGVELSDYAADFARQQYGLDVRTGLLEETKLPADSFDVAVLLHTLEHHPDPARTLREVKRILKPGGLIYLEVPNLSTADAVLSAAHRRRILLAPFHLFAFTPDTLGRFLIQGGYTGVLTHPFISAILAGELARGKRLVRHLIPSFPGREPDTTVTRVGKPIRSKAPDTTVTRLKRAVQRLLPGYGMYAHAAKPV